MLSTLIDDPSPAISLQWLGSMREEIDCPDVIQGLLNHSYPNQILKKATDLNCTISDRKFAKYMDERDPLRRIRQLFHYPKMKEVDGPDLSLVHPDEDCVYFCGNSLGLCPKDAKSHFDVELEKWAKKGMQGYFHRGQSLPWTNCHEFLDIDMARIVGSRAGEVSIMNALTVNLHLLLVSFYRPTKTRHKIMCEGKPFSSDLYAFKSQIRLHGFNPEKSLLFLEPREGEFTLRTEDILTKIEEEGETIAVICFSGIHYYTGQMFDMRSITRAGHAKGCYVGFDLAHAAGNVPLHLHDWGVDFACWCTYKYLNCGPGNLGCIFLHERHKDNDFPKLLGWWGHNVKTRFNFDNEIDLCPEAYAYRISNPSGLLYPSMKASLEIFNQTSMDDIRNKSILLTAYMEYLITKKYGRPDPKDAAFQQIRIITPSDPGERGAQLSLLLSANVSCVYTELIKRGVLCDLRKPHVIRVTPAPLYCSFEDVYRFMDFLDQAMNVATHSKNANRK
ncbi:kynureninase-like [Ylistrum balloti]|uniref:kynureninase-like n=1 Tax=Ylistrum balloti TaxID=509963 RepID=UPI002905EA68|nr:kynureninase-like [Ylistrum balloti]